MTDPSQPPAAPKASPDPRSPDDVVFSGSGSDSSTRGLIFGILGIAIFAIVGGLFLRGHDSSAPPPPNTILPADPAAVALVLSQLAMSQSASLSGQTSTFLDGHIKNTGTSTLIAASVQVVFHNDVNLAPTVEALPLTIIRMREPYIDTVLLSAAPLKPGQEADFRLIFESIPENWNQQMPEVRITHAVLK